MVGDHLIRGFIALSIDMGIGVDVPGAHTLKEGMKHTDIKVVDTEVIHMGTVMVLDTERKDWELWSWQKLAQEEPLWKTLERFEEP